MQSKIMDLVLFYPVFLFSLSVHETAHGWVSEKFGDPTARMLGRISLSPFPHMDMIGTVFLPIFGILTGAPVVKYISDACCSDINFKYGCKFMG